MYRDGYAPAKQNGKWGVVDNSGGEWLIEPQFDGVIQDELGSCGDPEALFVRQNGSVFLWRDGQEAGGPYEDARRFMTAGPR